MSHFSELDLEIKRSLGDIPYWKQIKPCPKCRARRICETFRTILGFQGRIITVRCANLECENSRAYSNRQRFLDCEISISGSASGLVLATNK